MASTNVANAVNLNNCGTGTVVGDRTEMGTLTDLFARMQQTLFEGVVQPLMFHVGLANQLEEGFAGTGWLLMGVTCLGDRDNSSKGLLIPDDIVLLG